MTDETVAPRRTDTALYRRSGTILVSGSAVLLSGVGPILAGLYLLITGDTIADALRTSVGSPRADGAFYLVVGVVVAWVGINVLRVRSWARQVTIVVGGLTLAIAAAQTLAHRDPGYLLQPSLAALAAALLLAPGVSDAFAEVARERNATPRD